MYLCSYDVQKNLHLQLSFAQRIYKKIHFHEFAQLDTKRAVLVETIQIFCFGHQWTLKIYPGELEATIEGGIREL